MIRALQDRVLNLVRSFFSPPLNLAASRPTLPGGRRDLSPTISPMKENLK